QVEGIPPYMRIRGRPGLSFKHLRSRLPVQHRYTLFGQPFHEFSNEGYSSKWFFNLLPDSPCDQKDPKTNEQDGKGKRKDLSCSDYEGEYPEQNEEESKTYHWPATLHSEYRT